MKLKKYLNYLLIPITALAFAGSVPSCAQYRAIVSPETNVQVSSYTVQAAEHTLRAAKDTFDLFFGLVHDNHDFVVRYLPQVYSFAQDMQVKAPDTLRRANRAKNAYKYNRSAANQTDLNTIMATVAQLMADAQRHTAEIKSSTP